MARLEILRACLFGWNRRKNTRRRGQERSRAIFELSPLERRLLLSASPTVTLDNSSVNVGDSVTMTLTPNDDLGDSDVGQWNANFGDGTGTDLQDYSISNTDTHTFTTDGHFTVTGGFQSIADPGSGGYYSTSATVDVADPNYAGPTVSATLSSSTPRLT